MLSYVARKMLWITLSISAQSRRALLYISLLSQGSLNPGQDWYTGGSSFLTLKETKEHLLTEMKYIKAAFQKLLDLKETVECQMSDLDLTGNLFEDVLNVGELLAEAKISAEEFTGAYKTINTYEEIFRNNGGAIPFTGSDDLPF